MGEGRTKQWGTETSGDLWKGEGWDGEHRVYKMDTTGIFRSLHDRDIEGGGLMRGENIVVLDGGR